MNFILENQGIHSYLVYSIEQDDEIDSMSLGMIMNNKISGISPAIFIQKDMSKFIKYNITSKISVKQLFTGTVNKKCLLSVFNGIVDGLLATEEYMIDIKSIILDPDFIFADVSTFETNLICLPVSNKSQNVVDCGDFFKRIMFNTRFDQSENCDYVTKIIGYLNNTKAFSLQDFKKLLLDIQKNINITVNKPVPNTQVQAPLTKASATPAQQPKATPEKKPPMPSVAIPPVAPKEKKSEVPAEKDNGEKMSLFYLLQHYNAENVEKYKAQKASKSDKNKASEPKKPATNPGFAIPGQENAPVVKEQDKAQEAPNPQIKPQVSPADFGETVVLTPFKSEKTVKPYLIRLKNNEKVEIDKIIFRIGKARNYVDYCISDNTTISRKHAYIITKGEEYFIVDTNSTNHTFVNGSKIQVETEVKINPGDKIRLSNEDFELKLL